MIGTRAIACQAKCCLNSMQFVVRLGNRGDEPSMVKTLKAPSPKIILHQNKTKCYCREGTNNDDDDRLIVPNPRSHGQRHRPPSCGPGVHGSQGILG
jgi:hypothetical protein